MFGSVEQQMEHLVNKRQWEKLDKKLKSADAKTRQAAAAACGGSSDEHAANLLINLLKDDDKAVQLEAVKAIGMSGGQSAKTHLQWLSERLTENDGALADAIRESISEINRRK